MKQFIVFVSKEFRHIFRDKRTMLILLVMPIIMIILFVKRAKRDDDIFCD